MTRQLLEWLSIINDERPSRATKIIPATRMIAERERMKQLPLPPQEYALRFPVHVG